MSSHSRKRKPTTLRAWREGRGWTLQQAADYLAMPLTSYYYLETGARQSRRDVLRRVMAATGVSVEALLGLEAA